MDVERYISALDQYNHLGSDITDQDKRILLEFSFTEELLSTYKIHSKYKQGQMTGHSSRNVEIAYKNVHKHVKKLESLGLIEPIKQDTKHGAIYYRITEGGMFQLFLQQDLQVDDLAIALSVILNTHGKYLIFETFLYPCLNKATLRAMKLTDERPLWTRFGSTNSGANYELTSLILEYLKNCCIKTYSFRHIFSQLPVDSMPREVLLDLLERRISFLRDVLVMKILLCLRHQIDISDWDQKTAISILAQDKKFVNITHNLQKDFKEILDITTHPRTRSVSPPNMTL